MEGFLDAPVTNAVINVQRAKPQKVVINGTPTRASAAPTLAPAGVGSPAKIGAKKNKHIIMGYFPFRLTTIPLSFTVWNLSPDTRTA